MPILDFRVSTNTLFTPLTTHNFVHTAVASSVFILLSGSGANVYALDPPKIKPERAIQVVLNNKSVPVPAVPDAHASEPNLLVFELQLDGSRLSGSFNVYEIESEIFLPIGELARLLTLGVTVDPSTRNATGFLLRENSNFQLLFDKKEVVLLGQAQPKAVDPSSILWIDDDLYVASSLIKLWWPVDFNVSFTALTLKVLPREVLPIQAKLERERASAGRGGRTGIDSSELNYPQLDSDYQIISTPFIDQTLGFQVGKDSDGKESNDASYTALLTGDLLGMEASLYLNSTESKAESDVRFTLARNDPEPSMLGPLGARSVALGHVSVPTLSNVLRSGSGNSNGLLISNKPLNQPSSFGSHKPQGELQPGWDVTLFINDALIGLRQSRPDGLFEFEEQQLIFGRNEFRLVFNGPLGQTRVEREVFIFDRTQTRQGEFHYTVGAQRSDDGSKRQNAQFDVGLTDKLSATMGLVGLEEQATGNATDKLPSSYANLGLRSSVAGFLLNADIARAEGRGHIAEFGLRTALGNYSLELTRTQLNDFASEYHPVSSNPLRNRNQVRLNGILTSKSLNLSLPLSFELLREETLLGQRTYKFETRQSSNLAGTNFSHQLKWQSSSNVKTTSGNIQVSRRMAGVGLNSQLVYSLKPKSELISWALTADKLLAQNSRLNAGFVQTLDNRETTLTAGLTRNFGGFGFTVTGRYGNRGERGVGIQFSTSMGKNPRNDRWINDWQPMASSGAVSVQAYLDANLNGVRDPNEEPISAAGFLINGGGRHATRTDENGQAMLTRLSPKAYTDVALDEGSLEDPQWQAVAEGFRVLPRPGKVYEIDFPVVMTGEVDGTISVQDNGKTREIGNALLELVDEQDKVVMSVRSSSDGYYLMDGIRPGRYALRINPEQIERLLIEPIKPIEIIALGDGQLFNGQDFLLVKRFLNTPSQVSPSTSGTSGISFNPAAEIVTPVTTQNPPADTNIVFRDDVVISFGFDEYTLKPEEIAKLDQLIKQLADVDIDFVIIHGHADSIGSKVYNHQLSVRRAEAVRTYLTNKVIAAGRIHSEGRGEKEPIGDNSDREGRSKNRRVEINVTGTLQKK